VSIIVEAASSVLEEEGFEGFNTNAVGAKAGVSIGSVYQYFTSKEALLSAVIGRESAPLLRVTEKLSQACSFHAAIFSIAAVIEHILEFPDAPKVTNRSIAAADVLAITRGLVDAAGERREASVHRLDAETARCRLGIHNR